MITKKVQKLIIWGGFSGLLLILYNFDVRFTNTCGFCVSSITYRKWFSEKLRDRLFQKVKRSKRNYHELLLLVNLYKFFFPLDDFALYILPCSEKENTLKETFTKVKLKVPLWCSHYYTSNHILLLTILCKLNVALYGRAFVIPI